MLPKNWGEPMGAPAIFEKQIEIKLLHPASTEGVTDSGTRKIQHRLRTLLSAGATMAVTMATDSAHRIVDVSCRK
ncbi:MAG: hypothetical protein P8X89_18865 [Reinekea sp.]